MAKVVATMRIMPDSPQVDMHALETHAKKAILSCVGDSDFKVTVLPIAFGLSALDIIFVMDEKMGATDPIEAKVKDLAGVQSVEITDVRRAIG
jgi:elongation factor 1-beta